MRAFIKKLTHPFLKLGLKFYYFKPRKYCYDGICLKIHPNVFPPQLTLSTKIFLDFIKEIDLIEKSFLELGCGSGILSLFATKKGATVTATDINRTALDFLKKNALNNKMQLSIIESDLFENIQNQPFDYIFINPPYYPKNPKNIKEKAWFCGENFEYFKQLFLQLPKYLNSKNQTFMILSEDCEIEKIKSIANKSGINFTLVHQERKLAENNFIFRLTS